MAAKIERGYPFPNGSVHKEAQEVGPYPPWDQWKQEVDKEFPGVLNGNRDLENFFRAFYIERRLYQKTGELNKEKINRLWEGIKERVRNFEEKYGDVVYFIVQKTEIKKPRPRR